MSLHIVNSKAVCHNFDPIAVVLEIASTHARTTRQKTHSPRRQLAGPADLGPEARRAQRRHARAAAAELEDPDLDAGPVRAEGGTRRRTRTVGCGKNSEGRAKHSRATK